ncbi:hypothetical protein Cus16_3002 [Curtobacterium sp. ER1/6]|nr:hypothetical protein Cus16_3002 [Curtobacterium sp. ER1/6]
MEHGVVHGQPGGERLAGEDGGTDAQERTLRAAPQPDDVLERRVLVEGRPHRRGRQRLGEQERRDGPGPLRCRPRDLVRLEPGRRVRLAPDGRHELHARERRHARVRDVGDRPAGGHQDRVPGHEPHPLDRGRDRSGQVRAEGRLVGDRRQVHGAEPEHDLQALGEGHRLVLEGVDDLDADEPGAPRLGHESTDGRPGHPEPLGDLALGGVLEVVHPRRLVDGVEREAAPGPLRHGRALGGHAAGPFTSVGHRRS